MIQNFTGMTPAQSEFSPYAHPDPKNVNISACGVKEIFNTDEAIIRRNTDKAYREAQKEMKKYIKGV